MNIENIDQLIFPDRPHSPDFDYSTDQWIAIVKHTMDRFERFLGTPIDHENIVESGLNQGFSIDIVSPAPALGAFNITWKGIFGATWLVEPESKNSNLYITATLFLYSNTKKMETKSNDGFLEYEYAKLDDKTFRWRPFIKNAWMIDEFEEYEFFDDPDKRFVT